MNLIKLYRQFHKTPELGFREYKTSALIKKTLAGIGLKYETVCGTGVVVNIKGTNPNKTVGFRADIDGLPIVEQNDFAWASKNGCMHACGHDAHTTILLGFAEYLSQNQPKQNVQLVWQPSEEDSIGATDVLVTGKVRADVFYALHVDQFTECEKISTMDGSICGGGAYIKFICNGTARASRLADGTQDAILVFADLVKESTKLNWGNTIFNISCVSSGDNVANIICPQVTAIADIRYWDDKAWKLVTQNLNNLCETVNAKTYGTVEWEIVSKSTYIPTINSPKPTALVRSLSNCISCESTRGCEDFAFFIKQFTGCLFWLGCKTDGENYPNHNAKFRINENCLDVGVTAFKEVLRKESFKNHLT